jgi:putative hydrolase of the HAD superfamily
MKIAAIGFDADDTLWHNEDHFFATEEAFSDLLRPWASAEEASAELLRTETNNLELFGYGVKSFTLSMIEAAMTLSGGEIASSDLAVLLERGKDMLARPASMLPGVVETLEHLAGSHRLVLITKGDLHHQHKKVEQSGVMRWFAEVEVVREKDTSTYAALLTKHGLRADEFVMVGNSIQSDILPVTTLGGTGVHIPYVYTWAHEQADSATINEQRSSGTFWELSSIREVPALVNRIETRRAL